jgi:Cupin-like domain
LHSSSSKIPNNHHKKHKPTCPFGVIRESTARKESKAMSKATIVAGDEIRSAQEYNVAVPAQDWAMTAGFWKDFVDNFWEKSPVLIHSVFPEPLLSEEEAFQLMRLSNHAPQSERHVFIDGARRACDVEPFFPAAEDSSLLAYRERLQHLVQGRDVTILLPKLQTYAPDLWMRTRKFLQGLYKNIGIPASAADLDMFYGKYARTPHGIHRDESSNFTYVVSGTKKMLFWPPDAFPENMGRALGTMRYEDYLDTAIAIEGKAGDVLFWPASYWHMAVSDGGWPLTLNLNSYLVRSPLYSIFQVLSSPYFAASLPASPKLLDAQSETGFSALKVPPAIQELRELAHTLTKDGHFQEMAEELWFKKLSASGFEAVPPPTAIPKLPKESIVQGDADFPILLVEGNNAQGKIFANGHMIEMPMSPGLIAVISRINMGKHIRVGDLLTDSLGNVENGADSAEKLHGLLESLASFRAIRYWEK